MTSLAGIRIKDHIGQPITSINRFPITGGATSSFGEEIVVTLSSMIQIIFPYNLNSRIVETRNNNGTITVDNSRAKLSTGAAANQSAEFRSVNILKYQPGNGIRVRYTRIWTTGVTGSTQIQGVGNESDGFFFGYNGADFGILRRTGGAPEIRTFTITTASTTAENITITLDGDTDTGVAVTNTGNTTLTANEIAVHDFSGLGRGWKATAVGSTVIFTSYNASSRTGAYSLSAATAVATVAQTMAGVAVTDTWTNQTDWNADKMDGTGLSEMSIDKTLGNVFQIQYQWLGYGAITFSVENDRTGNFETVHRIMYSNKNLNTSVQNPFLNLFACVENTTNTTDIIAFTPSFVGFIEGEISDDGVISGITISKAGIGTTQTPILTIRNKEIYQGKTNRVPVQLTFATVSVDGTKPALVDFILNSQLTDASYSDVNTNTSVIEADSSATALTGGIEQLGIGLAKQDGKLVPFAAINFVLAPGESITLAVAASSGSTDVVVSFNWKEFF